MLVYVLINDFARCREICSQGFQKLLEFHLKWYLPLFSQLVVITVKYDNLNSSHRARLKFLSRKDSYAMFLPKKNSTDSRYEPFLHDESVIQR